MCEDSDSIEDILDGVSSDFVGLTEVQSALVGGRVFEIVGVEVDRSVGSGNWSPSRVRCVRRVALVSE